MYYFITGAHNCQVLKKIDLPLTPEKLSLLPSPAHGPDGNFRIQISFTVNIGSPQHKHKIDAWKLMEPHIQHIYPAARLKAESYMELPDLNCIDQTSKLTSIRQEDNSKKIVRAHSSFYHWQNFFRFNQHATCPRHLPHHQPTHQRIHLRKSHQCQRK